MDKQEALWLLWNEPYKIGHWVGFRDLTQLHNDWLKMFLYSDEDITLQGHRGSYKTTTLSLFFSIHCVTKPNETIMFFRKTGVNEVILQAGNILQSPCMNEIVRAIYGFDLKVTKASSFAIETNLKTSIGGAPQISGHGLFGSITGLHADIVVTDDIVNVQDRLSRVERDHTKTVYQEMINIKNRGGRFINTGTPWHKDDAFSIMPTPLRYDCYHTGLITKQELGKIKDSMSPSLFAANYELRHIASEDIIFTEPQVDADPALCEQGLMQVDSAFYGEDYTAWTVMKKHDDTYYVYGRMKRRHVEDCYDDIKADYDRFMCGKLYNESNADKGMVGKEFRKQGMKVILYHEDMNKYMKIVTYLKAIWKNVIFVKGTDPEYIDQICDYFEDAEHDDAPDSAASLARILYKKKKSDYKPMWV